MSAQSSAEVVWEGTLAKGSGKVEPESGAFRSLPVDFDTRVKRVAGRTSPEELLASSHAACFAMACSAVLGKGGHPPERLTVRATATLDPDKLKVTTMRLSLRGKVPGMDAAAFESAAKEAEKICPISNALRGNVEISLDAKLE